MMSKSPLRGAPPEMEPAPKRSGELSGRISMIERLQTIILGKLPASMNCRASALEFLLDSLSEHKTLEGCVEAIENLGEISSFLRAKFVGVLKLAMSYDHPHLAMLIRAFEEYENRKPALIELDDTQWPLLVADTPDEHKPRLLDENQVPRYDARCFQDMYPGLMISQMDNLFNHNPAGFSRAIENLVAQGNNPANWLIRRYQQAGHSRHLPQNDVRRQAVWEDRFPSMHVFEIRERYPVLIRDLFSATPAQEIANRAVDAFISITCPRGRPTEDQEFQETFDLLTLNNDLVFEYPLDGTPAFNKFLDYLGSRNVPIADLVVDYLQVEENLKNPSIRTKLISSPLSSQRTRRQRSLILLDHLTGISSASTQQTQRTAWLNTLIRRIPREEWFEYELTDTQWVTLYRHLGDKRFLMGVQAPIGLEEALQHDLGL
jgi:hypothetical protein